MSQPIVHLMYFPWDRDQKLKADPDAFDHAPYEAMRAYAKGMNVRLWTYPEAKSFCEAWYPEVWAALRTVSRPVMLVDVLRWVVVHHFGGIYWQLNATPLRAMEAYLPAPGINVRLFTEFELTPEQCRAAASEPIRNGESEEPTRVLIQAFAAEPGAAFVRKTLDFLVERVRTFVPQRDYDILYITGNAAVSTAYDRFGKTDAGVERIGLEGSRRMLKWHYQGAWRMDAPPSAPLPPVPPAATPRLDRFPGLAAAGYQWLRVHPHEALLCRLDAQQPRSSCLQALLPWIEKTGMRRICEAPSGKYEGGAGGMEYFGGDPNRLVAQDNRRRSEGARVRFAHVNLLYSRFPPADLFICPDFLEWLSHGEALRVLRRILATAQPQYVALTGYRLLRDAWDIALGDFRPIDFRQEPFRFPEPLETVALKPLADGRPDRCLMVWDARQLHPA